MPKRILYSVDRWGPAVVSIITLLSLVAIGWIYSEKIAYVEGKSDTLQHQVDSFIQKDQASKEEIAALRNWIIAVYERGSARGWDMPKLPNEITDKEKENGN